jgi:hypothetical protein
MYSSPFSIANQRVIGVFDMTRQDPPEFSGNELQLTSSGAALQNRILTTTLTINLPTPSRFRPESRVHCIAIRCCSTEFPDSQISESSQRNIRTSDIMDSGLGSNTSLPDVNKLSDVEKRELQQFMVNEDQKARVQRCKKLRSPPSSPSSEP